MQLKTEIDNKVQAVQTKLHKGSESIVTQEIPARIHLTGLSKKSSSVQESDR